MNIALFFISHEGIASNLLTIGEAILQIPNSNLSYQEVPMDADIDTINASIEKKLDALDISNGVVFISDLYGSTPCNIAKHFANRYDSPLISGINLPMVIRLLNYRHDNKQDLLTKARDGARDGIRLSN